MEHKQPAWMADLSAREQAQVMHAMAYAAHWDDAGVPGHGQFILIAKLAVKLAEAEEAQGHQQPATGQK
jgi:hypothetical protein